jgi:hypothetical protein
VALNGPSTVIISPVKWDWYVLACDGAGMC